MPIGSGTGPRCVGTFLRLWILPRPSKKFHPEWGGMLLFRVDNIDVTSTAHYCDDDCLMPTPVPGAFIRQWILPRPKKVSPGHFFTPAAPGPAFRIPYAHQKRSTPTGVDLFWRRVWDSNPRFLAESPVFKTGSLNHSDNSP